MPLRAESPLCPQRACQRRTTVGLGRRVPAVLASARLSHVARATVGATAIPRQACPTSQFPLCRRACEPRLSLGLARTPGKDPTPAPTRCTALIHNEETR